MSPVKCRLLNAASQPPYQLLLVSEESPLQRGAPSKEIRVTETEILQGFEGGHESIPRLIVPVSEGTPLTEWASSINELAHAFNEPAPAQLIGGVRLSLVPAEAQQE